MRVRNLMLADMIVLRKGDTVDKAMQAMVARGLRVLPVVDEGYRLLGVVSDTDIVRLAMPAYAEMLGDLSMLPDDFGPVERRLADAGDMLVEDMMAREPLRVSEDTTLIDAAWRMLHSEQRRAFVERDGVLVGTVGLKEILSEMLRA